MYFWNWKKRDLSLLDRKCSILTAFAKRRNFENPLCLLITQTYFAKVNKLSLNEDITKFTLFHKL